MLPRPPPRAIEVPVRERTGLWVVSETRAKEKLAVALTERLVELRSMGLDERAWLPFFGQKRVQQRLRDRWLASVDGQWYCQQAWSGFG